MAFKWYVSYIRYVALHSLCRRCVKHIHSFVLILLSVASCCISWKRRVQCLVVYLSKLYLYLLSATSVLLCHAFEFIYITCFALVMFISQSEAKYNTTTPVVKKSYGLYVEGKIEGPSFSCLLFMLFSVWCGHGWVERNVLCDLLHALFAGRWKTMSFTSSVAWLLLRNRNKRNALSNTQICQLLCGRWHRAESWSLPEISELRYLEGDVDMNNKEIDVHYVVQRV